MNLAKICVDQPVLAVMLNLVFIFLGIVSFLTLTMDLFPEADIPVVTVRTIWRGAAPKEIESQITKEIEDAVATISGIERRYHATLLVRGLSLACHEPPLEQNCLLFKTGWKHRNLHDELGRE